MLRSSLRSQPVFSAARFYSTGKPDIKLVAELRKRTEVSLTKAREALAASGNDVNAALDWLEQDLAVSGAKKAAKLEGRTANEGLVGVCVLSAGSGSGQGAGRGSTRAAMVELNCETDFVGRNELFGRLLADIAHTAAFIAEPADSEDLLVPCPLDMLHDAPLISSTDPSVQARATVASAIRDTIAKVGEKISLRRAVTVARQPFASNELGLRVASYVHGSVGLPSQGRIGTLALLALKSNSLRDVLSKPDFLADLEKLERSIARQIVGFDTQMIQSSSGEETETALYQQPFMMFADNPQGENVEQVLRRWAKEKGLATNPESEGLEVIEFKKWSVGGDEVSALGA
ncbi:hypothetical protein GLOTRDRAFT_105438 [Gloeophyllum trabeum ATCC 11539]|uniref:Elongation factor Ts, mitochondrial n=1 Tax=Gloeophyllum trabeum (strain ATCC 11539 / FP-39264 / Madison 617) TaxID=670483 RepID=S7Q9H5_GLOTA|nr:uncharacterized protein GLOTRDRAFT_105438 [Gloeophyllum trabeum ATCC 11539]EPQ56576.1 hypothetical protein GLOTRDRAFT_105438 [Gloeophyllum trabeum ATCC 11539]